MRSSARVFVPLLVIALLTAFSNLGLSAETPAVAPAVKASASESETRKEILGIEHREAQAMLRGDAAVLEGLWAPDLVITASSNKIRTGADVLGHIRSGKMKLTKLERITERVAVHGQVAIAMGEEAFTPAGGEGAGKPFRRRYTNVYAQQDGRWRLIARQASLIATTP
jgi:uncharacterized protein (TIGR02246 family)